MTSELLGYLRNLRPWQLDSTSAKPGLLLWSGSLESRVQSRSNWGEWGEVTARWAGGSEGLLQLHCPTLWRLEMSFCGPTSFLLVDPVSAGHCGVFTELQFS